MSEYLNFVIHRQIRWNTEANIYKLRFIEFKDDFAKVDNELCKEAQISMGRSSNSKYYSTGTNSTILIQGNTDLKNGEIVPRIYIGSVTKCYQKNDIIMTVSSPV